MCNSIKIQMILIFSLMVFFASDGNAQTASISKYFKIDPEIYIPRFDQQSVTIDNDEQPPFEPNIIEAKYLKPSPPRTLQERVDRIIQGIKIDLPPEYDHYGYEIRRYMQFVGNPSIYTDRQFLVDQISNLNKADVVLAYWRKSLAQEASEIEDIIEKENSPSSIRTAFKQNAVASRYFMSLSQSWIDTNMNVLKFLEQRDGQYELDYPRVKFKNPKDNEKFVVILTEKQKVITEIRTYTPFALMVY